jgi:hypothetical protein
MRIGIGCTTFNRPSNLLEWRKQISKFTGVKAIEDIDYIKTYCPEGFEYTIYIATDTDEDRKGVAFRKNECLRALKDCDYVFLFDDDCFPIKDGWVDFFVNSGCGHLLYLNETHNFIFKDEKTARYKNCGGVFMFMAKEIIEKVGAFDEKFTPYGFEHCDWSDRAYSWYGYKHGGYYMLNGTEQYIYSHDYSTPNHKSSIADEEKNKCIKNNWNKFFNRNIENIYIPL